MGMITEATLLNIQTDIRENFRKEILEAIDKKESELSDEDANGHIMWNRMREFIKSL